MNYRAMSHVEMIVSFSIFFISVLFVFSFLNPVKQPDISSSLLKAVEIGVEDYSTTLLEVPVIVDEGVPLSSCFKIVSPFTSTYPSSIFVKNSSDELVGFNAESSGCTTYNGQPIGCISINPSSATSRFYYIYQIEDGEISFSPISCSSALLANESYEFSIPRFKEIYLNVTIGDKTLDKLKLNYETDYEGLKQKFNFPKESDFAITIRKMDTNIVKMDLNQEKPEKVVIKAKEIPIAILEKTSTNEVVEVDADMSIQVW